MMLLTQIIVRYQFVNLKIKINYSYSIDNLIKGGAGQAVQNLNLIFNFRLNEGLK